MFREHSEHSAWVFGVQVKETVPRHYAVETARQRCVFLAVFDDDLQVASFSNGGRPLFPQWGHSLRGGPPASHRGSSYAAESGSAKTSISQTGSI
jgi:hypothetical protein